MGARYLMSKKSMYLVRDGLGRMNTVVAQSEKGAVREFLHKYPTTPGETLAVKLRGGSAIWALYKVS